MKRRRRMVWAIILIAGFMLLGAPPACQPPTRPEVEYCDPTGCHNVWIEDIWADKNGYFYADFAMAPAYAYKATLVVWQGGDFAGSATSGSLDQHMPMDTMYGHLFVAFNPERPAYARITVNVTLSMVDPRNERTRQNAASDTASWMGDDPPPIRGPGCALQNQAGPTGI